MAESENISKGSSTPLDEQDFLILDLALDLLDRSAQDELANKPNSTKRSAMINMRSRILIVRTKLRTMQVQS
jgi:hypothetical protein